MVVLHGAVHSPLFTPEIQWRGLPRQTGIEFRSMVIRQCHWLPHRSTPGRSSSVLPLFCEVTGAIASPSKLLDSGIRGCELRESRTVLQLGMPFVHEARHVLLYPGSSIPKEEEEAAILQGEYRALPIQNAPPYGGAMTRCVGGGNTDFWGVFREVFPDVLISCPGDFFMYRGKVLSCRGEVGRLTVRKKSSGQASTWA